MGGLLAVAMAAGCSDGRERRCSSPGPVRAAAASRGGSAEGWKPAQDPACNIGAGLCTATAGYDGANGNPAGSLAATTNVLVNVGGLFKSTAVFESPNFTATEGRAGCVLAGPAAGLGQTCWT